MRKMEKTARNNRKYGFLCIVISMLMSTSMLPAQQSITENNSPEGTLSVWGYVDNLEINGLVEGPATAGAELQVACVFEYTEGDIFNSPPALPAAVNGMLHLDEALKGQITQIRKTGRFKGEALSTLLITPPQGAIKAKMLLLVGLGDRNSFTPELMTSIGEVAAREAIKLGVKSFAVASDLKDAGIDSPTALVVENITKGIIDALRVQKYLKENGLSARAIPDKVYLLSGPAFFTTAGEGIRKAIGDS